MDPTQRSQPQLIEWVTPAVLAFFVALPVLVLLVKVVSGLPVGAKVAGDPAVIELYTLRATTGEQLLGPYSRFGFHHPGPLVFYCLAPFYLALGKSYAALCVGALVLNLASLIGVAVVVWRVAGPACWPWSCAALTAYVVYLHPAVLLSAWNPDITILPLALALVAFAAVMAGYTAYLPLAVVVASFAAQSHLPCAGPVACVASLSLVALIIRRGEGGATVAGSTSRVFRHVMIAGALGVVLWLPPLIEQVRDDPGNLTLILRFLGESHESRPLGSSLLAVASQMSAYLLSPLGLRSQAAPSPGLVPILGMIAAALLALLVLGVLRSWRRGDGFGVASCGSSILLLVVGLVVTGGITGRLHPYLVRWVSAVGLLSSFAVAAAFSPPRRSSSRGGRLQLAACAVLVVTMTTLGLRDVIGFSGLSRSIPSAWPDRLSDATLSALAARDVHRPHLRILSHRGWEQAAGVVLECTKAGRTPSVDAAWLFMFGETCRFRGSDDGVVLVADPTIAAQLATVRGVEPVARAGEDTVLLATADRAPIPELPLGSWEADIYLRGGFSRPESEPEGGFRWSNGTVSWIVLPASPGRPYRLTLLACPIAVPGMQQELTVEVNRERVATVTMDPAWAIYSLPVPGGLLRTRNLIGFRYAYSRSPYELAGTDDRRRLGVRFRTISLSEVPGR